MSCMCTGRFLSQVLRSSERAATVFVLYSSVRVVVAALMLKSLISESIRFRRTICARRDEARSFETNTVKPWARVMVRKVASFIGSGMFGCGIISRGSRTPVEDQTSIMQRVHHTVLNVRCGVFELFGVNYKPLVFTSCSTRFGAWQFGRSRSWAIRHAIE